MQIPGQYWVQINSHDKSWILRIHSTEQEFATDSL